MPLGCQWRLLTVGALASTSSYCVARAVDGEPARLAVRAERQTAGRGSRGRFWASPEGNLFLSVLLRPGGCARDLGGWALLAAVVLAEVLAADLSEPCSLALKWPNDIMLDGAKLAGILLDSATGPEGALDWLVIGFGANLAAAPQLPDRRTSCLADAGVIVPPGVVAERVLDRLDHWDALRRSVGFGVVRSAWLERGPAVGDPLTVALGDRQHSGRFLGLDEDNALLLEVDGRRSAFRAGEVLTGATG
jgi:BirA family biotin operon repressor/biotin-[acetyl-CoA-carboxylase] ligase